MYIACDIGKKELNKIFHVIATLSSFKAFFLLSSFPIINTIQVTLAYLIFFFQTLRVLGLYHKPNTFYVLLYYYFLFSSLKFCLDVIECQRWNKASFRVGLFSLNTSICGYGIDIT